MRPRTHPQHAAPTRPPAACTVIAANQLSFARILAESYLRHHPGAPFYLLVADPLPEGVAPPPAVTLVTPADLDLPYLEDLLATYQPAELLAALKPSLLLLLIRRFATEVVYLDPDALVMRPFAELAAAWTAGEVVLTPRLLRPSGSGDASWRERLALRDGTFNLGIVAVRRSDAAEQLLRWWEAHLRDECRADPCRGLMWDQRWLDLAPHLFPSVVAVLRDETYGVGAWSLDERALTSDDGGFRVDGRPLAFFRFEGLDPRTPDRFSIADASLAIEAGTPLADLVAHYVRLQHEHGFVRSSGWRFAYDVLVGGSFDNGIAVPAIMEELYRSLDPAERARFGDPRRTGGPASFFAWATLPRPAEGRLSPFLERVYRRRFDVAASYPDPVGADQAAFLAWARTHGAVELGYDPRLVVEPPESPASIPTVERRVGLPWGINVVGYLRNRSGVGAAARGYVRALLAVDVPVGLTDVSWMNPTPLLDRSLDGLPDDVNAYAVNLIVVNADQHPIVKERLGRAFFRDRHNVAVWAWELPSFPVAWRDRFDDYDEVWVGSSFIAEALAGVSPIPVVRIPPVLAAPAGTPRSPRGGSSAPRHSRTSSTSRVSWSGRTPSG